MNLSYIHGTAARPLIGETIGDFLDHVAIEFPDNEALVSTFENQRYTYAELLAEVNRVARSLMALGVQKGERVGIWSTNCVAWVLAQFATAKIGAILVNVNPAYGTYELEYALRQSECNVLISGERFKDADYAKMLREILPELASADSNHDLHTKKLPLLRRVIFLGTQKQPGMLSWAELLKLSERTSSDELAERQATLEFDDPINIQY